MDIDAVEQILRERGCTLTAQRRAVLRYLDGNLDHPTAADVLAAVTRDFPVSSRATVYNTLTLLEDVGVVRALRGEDGEVRYDPNVDAHHHLRCVTCGRLEDVPAGRVKVELDGRPAMGTVRFDGVCSGCQSVAG
jgi:Fur family transcriptional regulator, peroxide stress response regulator